MMKKKVLILAVLCFVSVAGLFAVDFQSYSPAYEEGDIAVQAGIGLIPTFGYGDVSIPPISVSADYALPIADLPLSFGGFVGYSASKEEFSYFTYNWSYEYTYLLIGARAAYHVDFGVENLDAYTGLLLGYNVVNVTVDGDDTFSSSSAGASSLLVGGYVGARYFFTENIAAFGEIGYGMGVITLGASFKF